VTELDASDGTCAWVDVGGARRRVNVSLLDDDAVRPGDWVLIHVGFALARIDEAEAQATLRMLEGMANAYADELRAMAWSASQDAAPEGAAGAAAPVES